MILANEPLHSNPDDDIHVYKDLMTGKGNVDVDLIEMSIMIS